MYRLSHCIIGGSRRHTQEKKSSKYQLSNEDDQLRRRTFTLQANVTSLSQPRNMMHGPPESTPRIHDPSLSNFKHSHLTNQRHPRSRRKTIEGMLRPAPPRQLLTPAPLWYIHKDSPTTFGISSRIVLPPWRQCSSQMRNGS